MRFFRHDGSGLVDGDGGGRRRGGAGGTRKRGMAAHLMVTRTEENETGRRECVRRIELEREGIEWRNEGRKEDWICWIDVGDGGSVERRLCFGQRRRMRFGFGLGGKGKRLFCLFGKAHPFCGPSLVRLLGGKRLHFLSTIFYNIIRFEFYYFYHYDSKDSSQCVPVYCIYSCSILYIEATIPLHRPVPRSGPMCGYLESMI